MKKEREVMNVFALMNEMKRTALAEDCCGYARVLVDAYNEICDNTPICDLEAEDVGGYDLSPLTFINLEKTRLVLSSKSNEEGLLLEYVQPLEDEDSEEFMVVEGEMSPKVLHFDTFRLFNPGVAKEIESHITNPSVVRVVTRELKDGSSIHYFICPID